jgi:hypothetical protein
MLAFQTNEDLHTDPDGAACGGRQETTPCTDMTFLELLEMGIYPLGQGNPLRPQYIEVFAVNVNSFPDDIQQAHTLLAPDLLAAEKIKQKDSGKLVVYVTSTDSNATLSITAFPQPPLVTPIILGDMSRTDPGGKEFFIIRKGLPPIQSIEVSSTSGGTLAAPVKQPHGGSG